MRLSVGGLVSPGNFILLYNGKLCSGTKGVITDSLARSEHWSQPSRHVLLFLHPQGTLFKNTFFFLHHTAMMLSRPEEIINVKKLNIILYVSHFRTNQHVNYFSLLFPTVDHP